MANIGIKKDLRHVMSKRLKGSGRCQLPRHLYYRAGGCNLRLPSRATRTKQRARDFNQKSAFNGPALHISRGWNLRRVEPRGRRLRVSKKEASEAIARGNENGSFAQHRGPARCVLMSFP